MTAVARRSLLRRTIPAVIIVAFSVTLNAQNQSDNPPCNENARIFRRAGFSYCINVNPLSGSCTRNPDTFAACERAQFRIIGLVEDLIDVRSLAQRSESSPFDPQNPSVDLEKMKKLIDGLCTENFCGRAGFLGFPPLTKMTRSSLLEFIQIKVAESVDIQASGRVDLSYIKWLQQMEHAINILIAGNFAAPEIASR